MRFAASYFVPKGKRRCGLNMSSATPSLIFSYGSNSLAQLQGRVTQPPFLTSLPAIALDFVRVFWGLSQRWDSGSVASIVPAAGHVVFGLVATLTQSQLQELARFEGSYHLEPVAVMVRRPVDSHDDFQLQSAWAFVADRPHVADPAAWRPPR